jgi:Eukaryotic aspartyl protease
MLISGSVRAYTVTLMIGGINTSFILGRRLSLSSPLAKLTLLKDTGSSDLWTLSDACLSGCANGKNSNQVRVYPQSTFKYSGLDVEMQYGDSQTGTFARGLIGNDTVELAGMILHNQSFAAINITNTSVMDVSAAGIFGLGFPVNR